MSFDELEQASRERSERYRELFQDERILAFFLGLSEEATQRPVSAAIDPELHMHLLHYLLELDDLSFAALQERCPGLWTLLSPLREGSLGF